MPPVSETPPVAGSHNNVGNYQTVSIARRRGRDRATVMQLASMLAGERPTDRPLCTCPVISAFLRSYAEHIDDARRRDLYRCATDVVGTNVKFLEGRRVRLLADVLADAPVAWSPWRRADPERLIHAGRHERIAAMAGRALARAGEPGHRRALALIDEMVGMQRYPGTFELPAAVPSA